MSKGFSKVEDLFLWGRPEEIEKMPKLASGMPQFRLVNAAGGLPAGACRFALPEGKETALAQRCGGVEKPVARLIETEDAYWCFAAGVTAEDIHAERTVQAVDLFNQMNLVLASAGMTFANVIRTWLYVDKVCEWYGPFNATRTAFFEKHHVFETFLPASTGIGSANADGAAVTGGFIAMKPKPGSKVTVQLVESPLQEPAMAYKASFSRAAEIADASGRRLFVSGTASIKPHSHEVAYVGDIVRQIDCTMTAVRAIFTSRQMDWPDCVRAIIYLKKPEFHAAWRAWCAAHPDFPRENVLETICDVCRDQWLFEIEADGFKAHA